MSLRVMLAITAAGIPLGLASVVTGPASAAVRPATVAAPAAMTYRTTGRLAGVAAASNRSAWAVGYAGFRSQKVLMLHWNGAKWSRVTRPRVLTRPGHLNAITVVNAKDAWAVGDTGSSLHPHTLIMHWNGRAWSRVTRPAPVANGSLSAVTATRKRGWAVGYRSTGIAALDTSPVIFKLTGARWTRVARNFLKASGVELNGLATTSAHNTFAVGNFTGQITGVIERWNGHSWSNKVRWPESGVFHQLAGIAAGPHGTAFAVGTNTAAFNGRAIAVRWTGHSWVKAPAPAASLVAVAVAPGGRAWAAGSRFHNGAVRTVILRWNGRKWVRVSSPTPKGQLTGLGFSASKYGWAVGSTGLLRSKTRIMHWNGHSWR